MNNEPDEETRQERREKKLEKKRERMPKHGRSLAKECPNTGEAWPRYIRTLY